MFTIKFLNGHIAYLPEINQESVFNYIITNGKENDIDSDDLLFYEQISISNDISSDISNNINYIIIENLEIIHFYDVMKWIANRTEKKHYMIEQYIQYLANRSRLLLSTTSRYCELWYKPYTNQDYSEKVSSLWRLSEFDLFLEDTEKDCVRCTFPICTFNCRYHITANFKHSDLE